MQAHLSFPVGIKVVNLPGRARPVLIVKGPKEAILAAKLRGGFKVYVARFASKEHRTVGLISAFFDDLDEPLTLSSPLFEDEACAALRNGLLQSSLDVHLFDELNREWLSYTAAVEIPIPTRELLQNSTLYPATRELARSMLDGFPRFMGMRTSEDDALAISVRFTETIFPEEVFFLDMRPGPNAYHGRNAPRHSTLIRPEPGRLQEWDIVDLLQRVFPLEQIYLGPLRVTDREEIADVVVVTPSLVLLVQAKDSPNVESVSNNKLSRKRATAAGSLKKALAQVRGAVRYARSQHSLQMLVGEEVLSLNLNSRNILSLVVCKELFSDQFAEYSKLLLQTANSIGVPCVALDYSELNKYTTHLSGEDEFVAALRRVYDTGVEHGTFPRLRFGII